MSVWLWLVLILAIYLAGFTASARLYTYMQIKEKGRVDDEFLIKLLAGLWFLSIPIVSIIAVFQGLYALATRDAGLSREERKARRLAKLDKSIKDLEIKTEIVKPKPRPSEAYVELSPGNPFSIVKRYYPEIHDDSWGD